MLKKILKIKLKALGALAMGLILAQLISAYFFGVIAEKQLELQFKHFSNSSVIRVIKHEYARGWLNSTETVVLAVNNQFIKNVLNVLPNANKESISSLSTDVYQISYTTRINHGLLAGWLHGNILPTLAYTTTKVTFPTKINTILSKFFNGQDPLEIDNILYLNKAGKYSLYSPRFNYAEALSGVKVTWGGLLMTIAYNQEFNKFKNSLQLPLFELDAPTKGNLRLNNLNYASNSEYSRNNIKVGTTQLTLAGLTVEFKESNNLQLKFGEVVHLLTGVNSADFLNGIDAVNPSDFAINNVSYSSWSKDVNNFFSTNAQANFESLTTNNTSYGPLYFDLSLEHIAAPEFSHLLDSLNNIAGQDQNNPDNRLRTIKLLKTDLTPILSQQPLISLNSLKIKTPDGEINLSGTISSKNFVADDMTNQDKFTKKMLVQLKFSIPKPILAYLFVLQMKYFLTAGNAQMDKQSSDALTKVVNILLDNQLQVWLKKGYLNESANLISSRITMESGVFALNGIMTK